MASLNLALVRCSGQFCGAVEITDLLAPLKNTDYSDRDKVRNNRFHCDLDLNEVVDVGRTPRLNCIVQQGAQNGRPHA